MPKERLNQALTDNIVLVIRDQAGGIFGGCVRVRRTHAAAFHSVSAWETPLVNYVSNRDAYNGGTKQSCVVRAHTDHTNHERPPKCTSLYAVVLPDEGEYGGCNMRAGYAALMI